MGGGGLSLTMLETGQASLDGCVFWGNRAETGGALKVISGQLQMTSCTLAADSAGLGAELFLSGGAPVIENSILAFGIDGITVHCISGASPTLIACDVFGNEGGDWWGCLGGQGDLNDNFSLDPLFCNLAAGELTVESVSPCLPWNNDPGHHVGALWRGCPGVTAVHDLPGVAPVGPVNLQAFPNPFNPRTTISYELAAPGPVEVAIFDLRGRRMATLVDEFSAAGPHTVIWDGRDQRGRRAGSGVYSCRLTSTGWTASRKVVLLK